MQNHLKHELHNVLSGKSQIRYGTIIQSIASYLNNGAQTSAIIEDEKYFKKQETKRLENYISEKNLWIAIDLSHTARLACTVVVYTHFLEMIKEV